MEPALDVVNRALNGDAGARSFLERTTSIYVLDVTDLSNPKTYGCWNFIHQAMNEVERLEAKYIGQRPETVESLVAHVRMLASMALKVARRGPAADKSLVTTCVSNASQYPVSTEQSQWLVDLNLELREIVMGRIAAMAFDFSFHRSNSPNGKSAFADRVVMDTFCAILSANAVSSGPKAVGNFATDWIIPSAKNLPSFSVASIVLHLASEGMRKSAPAGTKDVLQQLSVPAMNVVLVPILSEAVSVNPDEINSSSSHDNSHLAAMTLRAIKTWCDATDLSLPQIKHICSKVDLNIVEVLSDAMYSASQFVIDALAELIETTILISDEKVMSTGRMNQVRYIIQVDKVSFQAEFSSQQLKLVESREMALIVDELMSAIGLQRFRFTDRQNKGDNDVCRNLARIASSVCNTCVEIISHTDLPPSHISESGVLSLLVKGASHPYINICAICLTVLTRLMPIIPSLSQELLPVLQRKAITPYHLKEGHLDFNATDLCGVNIHDFQQFRTTALADALIVCCKSQGSHYMDSCISAVEEFCSVSTPMDVSLHLEAALFCIEQISNESMFDLNGSFPFHSQMRRLMNVLPAKPLILMANPLTRERMCRLVRKFSKWFATNQSLDVVMDLVLTSLSVAIKSDHELVFINEVYYDASRSTIHDASTALKELCCESIYFANSNVISKLIELWEAVYISIEQTNTIHVNDRISMCDGIGRVIAALPVGQIAPGYETMLMLPVSRLDRWIAISRTAQSHTQISIVHRNVCSEIRILATLWTIIAERPGVYTSELGNTCKQETSEKVPESVLLIFQKVWPCITFAAEHWADNEDVAQCLSDFLIKLTPTLSDPDTDLKLVDDLCQVATVLLERPSGTHVHYDAVCNFMCHLVVRYGSIIDGIDLIFEKGKNLELAPRITEICTVLQTMIQKIIITAQTCLGNGWMSKNHSILNQKQNNGQVAFESTLQTAPKVPIKYNYEALSGVLLFLTQGLQSCPKFILQLQTTVDMDVSLGDYTNNTVPLLQRAIDSATSALNDSSDTELTKSIIAFLSTLMKFFHSNHQAISSLPLDDIVKQIRSIVISKLILGSCSKYEHSVLNDAAELLSLLLLQTSTIGTMTISDSELESYIVTPVQDSTVFLLGNRALQISYHFLVNYSSLAQQQSGSKTLLFQFIHDLWNLHEMDDIYALPYSDGVEHFILKYSAQL